MRNNSMIKPNDVDIVIIWVDGNDPKWRAEKGKYSGASLHDTADSASHRYRDWDNLKYLFRGIEQFTPWVRKVHFVTEGHLPKWLNTKSPKLNIVKHSDYIPEEYLPTFSPFPIELNLHRIKGLSEQFIFFNDDMFILKPIDKESFFYNGLPCDQPQMQLTTSDDMEDIFPYQLFNNMTVINKNFDKRAVIKSKPVNFFSPKYGIKSIFRNALLLPYKRFSGFYWPHLPAALLKSTYVELWRAEPKLLNEVSSHKFRHIQDINQYVLKAWQFASGTFHPRNMNKLGAYYDISSQKDQLLLAIQSKKHQIICANDTGVVEDFEKVKSELNNSLDKILPDKSGYEL